MFVKKIMLTAATAVFFLGMSCCQMEVYADEAEPEEVDMPISLGATLRDEKDGDSIVEGNGSGAVIASIAAVNLEPGYEYEYEVKLVYAQSGKPIFTKGEEVKESRKFIPRLTTELQEVKLVFDGLQNRGKTVAVEVTLLHDGKVVAEAESTAFTGGTVGVDSGQTEDEAVNEESETSEVTPANSVEQLTDDEQLATDAPEEVEHEDVNDERAENRKKPIIIVLGIVLLVACILIGPIGKRKDEVM